MAVYFNNSTSHVQLATVKCQQTWLKTPLGPITYLDNSKSISKVETV